MPSPYNHHLPLSTVQIQERSTHESTRHHGPPADTSSYFCLPSIPFLYNKPTKVSRSPRMHASQPGSPSDSSDPNPPPRYFINPWPSWRSLTLSDAYTAYYTGAVLKNAPKPGEMEDAMEHGRLVKVLRPKFRLTEEQARGPERVCWLGHASVLVQVPWQLPKPAPQRITSGASMCGILFDPIFSNRCSPTQWVGPSRYLDPPCTVDELPPIHVVCISHDHYDHLDYATIMDLWNINKRRIHFFVPLGVKSWFLSCNIPTDFITELDWHQSAIIKIPSSSQHVYQDDHPSKTSLSSASLPEISLSLNQSRASSTANLLPADSSSPFADSSNSGVDGVGDFDASVSLKITCTPAQHRSGRGLCDQMKTLWSSWIVATVDESMSLGASEEEGFKVFFAGDTGYRYAGAPEADLEEAICPAFREIAARYGPVTLSLLPISTGSSLSFLRTLLGISLNHYSLTSPQHSNSWDAIEISKIMGSKASVAIHHSTFSPEDESRGCAYEFDKTRREEDVPGAWGDDGCFVMSDVGEVLTIGVASKARVTADFDLGDS